MGKETSVLEAVLGKSQILSGLIEYSKDSIVSKTLIERSAGTITLFAFDKGQGLSEHQAPYNAFVAVIDGKGLITIGGKGTTVSAGDCIIMPANVPHSVKAEEKFKMLLVMIRS
jgi:quercetin dioxygenase-like cupin family protein